MNIEICYKYLEFLKKQCDQYLKDDEVEEEEINQLKIEFDKFVEEVDNSELPLKIKTKITEIKLDYEFIAKREYLELLGYWNFGKNRRQRKLKKMVEYFKNQINESLMFIKMNF